MRKNIRSNQILLAALVLTMALFQPACKTMKSSDGDKELPKMPGTRTNFLTAKVAAFRHAMANQPDEEKRYGDEYFAAAGILDGDPSHVKVLVAALQDMSPSVIEADQIYTRDENSKWLNGKPAVVWSSKVINITEDVHVFFVLGWMHSNLIYQYFEYETRYLAKKDAWEVVDYHPIERVEE